MKLIKMKKVIDKAIEHARRQRRLRAANVEVWLGEKEYGIDSISQSQLLSHIQIELMEVEQNPIGMEAITSGRVLGCINKAMKENSDEG